MSKDVFSNYLKIFNEYVSSYLDSCPEERENLILKKDHSLRVFENAKAIAESESLDKREAFLAGVAAIFHDLGRFPQLYEYNTFNDLESVNHGLAGYKAVRKEGLFKEFPWEEKKLLGQCILMHNRARLPSGLPKRLSLILKVIRDADKLDIVSVVLENLSRENPDSTVSLGLIKDSGRYNRRVFKQVAMGKGVDYKEMHWQNDFRLLVLSWIYDLNFAFTKNEFRERGYLKEIFSGLPQTVEIKNLETQVNKYFG